MAEKPILFSTPMVKAILAGTKTQTRHVIKKDLEPDLKFACKDAGGDWIFWTGPVDADMESFTKKVYPAGSGIKCPYGKPGDILWVKRSYVTYRQDAATTLLIKDIRVERLQDISFHDCLAEGIAPGEEWIESEQMDKHYPDTSKIADEQILDASYDAYAKSLFENLWNKINGAKYPWDSNPWLWVVEFEKL